MNTQPQKHGTVCVVQQFQNSLDNSEVINEIFYAFSDCDLSYKLPTLVKANEEDSFVSVLMLHFRSHTTQCTVNITT